MTAQRITISYNLGNLDEQSEADPTIYNALIVDTVCRAHPGADVRIDARHAQGVGGGQNCDCEADHGQDAWELYCEDDYTVARDLGSRGIIHELGEDAILWPVAEGGDGESHISVWEFIGPDGYLGRVANTNADPVWEEADAGEFAELLESVGIRA